MFLKSCANKILKTLKNTNQHEFSREASPQLKVQILSPHQFSHKFHQSSSIISASIQDYKIVDKSSSHKSYAVYIIRVTTEDLIFEIEKRYSQLLELSQNLVEKYQITVKFPPKTLIYNGTNTKVIKTRISVLNTFLQEIIQYKDKNPFVYFKLLAFLGVEKQYERLGIKLKKKQSKISQKNQKQVMINELTLLNKMPNNAIRYAENIEMIILDQKKKNLRIQAVKQVIMGCKQNKGIVQFCLRLQNQLSQIKILQIINRILNPINNPNSQTSLKYLLLLPSYVFQLKNQDSLKNQQLKVNYFCLLQHYQDKSDFNVSQILSSENCELYKEWKKMKENSMQKEIYRNRKNIMPQSPKQFKKIKKSDSVKKRQRQNVYNIFEQYTSQKIELNTIKEIKNQKINLLQQTSENNNILKFTIETKGDFGQNCEKLRHQSWNPLINNSKTDSFTNFLKQTMKVGKKQSKPLIFEFEEMKSCDRKISQETADDVDELDIAMNKQIICLIKKPPMFERQNSYNSYFQKCLIQKNQQKIIITIMMYFYEDSLRNYLLSQIEGKTNFMRDGIINSFFI